VGKESLDNIRHQFESAERKLLQIASINQLEREEKSGRGYGANAKWAWKVYVDGIAHSILRSARNQASNVIVAVREGGERCHPST
jgi:hypothetical protein